MGDRSTMNTLGILRRAGPLAAILLLGIWLRLAPWGQNRFMEDEALYSYWGLQIASGADPMLDYEPVDKPPVHPYTLALSFSLLVPSLSGGEVVLSPERVRFAETAARMPSLLASASSIVLIYGVTRALWRDTRPPGPNFDRSGSDSDRFREAEALLAALLLALSPFDILFASTALTDSLMTALVMAALLAAARDRMALAGLTAGLAAATKQQAVLFLPLVLAAALPISRRAGAKARQIQSHTNSAAQAQTLTWSALRQLARSAWRQRWLRFALGFIPVVIGSLWWDGARLQRPGFLEQSLISYGGLAPVSLHELAARGLEWLSLAGAFWVSPWFNGLLLVSLAAWIAVGLAGRGPGPTVIDLGILVFVVLYLGIHWLVGFQTWDRYLLGLVPLASVLAARSVVGLGRSLSSKRRRWVFTLGATAVLVAALFGPVIRATESELPLGGDHGAYDGIDDLAAHLRAKAPPGSVVYHMWLGYHYRFYLYGASLRTHWYPDLPDLVRDAVIYRREPRYIAFPSWREQGPTQFALGEAGITLVPLLETARRDGSISFRLYQLEGP